MQKTLLMRISKTFATIAICILATQAFLYAQHKKPYVSRGTIQYYDKCPSAGYQWPFFLYIPRPLIGKSNANLLVMPNNSGRADDSERFHIECALQQIFGWQPLADELNTILMVPCFQRPKSNWKLYTHALDRDCLLENTGSLARVDLQLCSMLDSVRVIMQDQGILIPKEALFFGFSAAGQFVNHFALLHPERVKAAAIGGAGWLTIPSETWNGKSLPYPLGMGDIATLTGKQFNHSRASIIPFFIFMGDEDTNDPVTYIEAFEISDQQWIFPTFGDTNLKRWPKLEKAYKDAGMNAEFHLYPSLGHQTSFNTEADMESFFHRVLNGTR